MKPDTQAADVVTAEVLAELIRRNNDAAEHIRQYGNPGSEQLPAESARVLEALSGLPAEVARLQSKLEAEQEAHAQLQARCFDGCATGDSVFDELSRLRGELSEARKELTKFRWVLERVRHRLRDSDWRDKGHSCESKSVVHAAIQMIDAALKDQQP